jgi:hypothetical protein
MVEKDVKFEDLDLGAVFVTEGEGEYVKVSNTQARRITLGEPFDFPAPTVSGEDQVGSLDPTVIA